MDPVAEDVWARMTAHLGGDPAQVGRLTVTAARGAEAVISPAEAPEVSVVTVTYGTGPIVLDCLAALAATLAGTPSEVIVVDQPVARGTDRALDTATRLRLSTRGVHLVSTDQNHGFGGGNTVGVAHARAPFVVLLNPDAVVRPGWWKALRTALDDPGVGIAAPLLRNPDGSLQEAGQTLDSRGITRAITELPTAAITDAVFASAACWALRRGDYMELGGFDPAYHPAYFEDADLALRFARAGMRTVVVSAGEVTHHHGSSTRERARPALAQQAVFRRRWATELAAMPDRTAHRPSGWVRATTLGG